MATISDQFKSMTPAQQSFVLSMFENEIFKNPKDYGIGEDGIIKVGDKLDLTKLFGKTKEIELIFEKAWQTITPGSAQETSILLNNQKISDWVGSHPGEVLNESKIAEILNNKPKVEIAPKPQPMPQNIPNKIQNSDLENQTHKEIEEAKQRLMELENKNVGVRNSNLERTLASDSKNYVSDIKLKDSVETAFKNEIDSVYGKKGLLGMGRVNGLKTREWGEMARLPASKVVEYYTNDSNNPNLADIAERLSKAKEHSLLMNQVTGLMEQSGGAVKPFENENMEQFIKRLGGYILKASLQNQLKRVA